ncbi:MAG TPA: phosphatidylglycerophosphatase A [Burkholderiaceae bacterium]
MTADAVAPRRATWRFMGLHPLRLMALGFGSGLAPKAPGTFGTLAGWILWVLIDRLFAPSFDAWCGVIVAGFFIGWWACTHTARALATADPSPVVWDEIIAFWIILAVAVPLMPAWPTGWTWLGQAILFGLFRLFDAVKRGPVGWADSLFKPKPGTLPGWPQGFGIIFDDLVAAACVLVVWFPLLWGLVAWLQPLPEGMHFRFVPAGG